MIDSYLQEQFEETDPERKETRDNKAFQMKFTPDGRHLVVIYGVYFMEGDWFVDQVDYLQTYDTATAQTVGPAVTGVFTDFRIHPTGNLVRPSSADDQHPSIA